MPGSPRKDYLEQQIEGVARLLARVLGVRDTAGDEAARAELEKGARTLLGVAMSSLDRVDVATAVGLLRSEAGAESYARLLEGAAGLEKDEAQADALRERARSIRAVREAGSPPN